LEIQLASFNQLNWPILGTPTYYFSAGDTAEVSVNCTHSFSHSFEPIMVVSVANSVVAIVDTPSEADCIAEVNPIAKSVKNGKAISLVLSDKYPALGRWGRVQFTTGGAAGE
jgi:hypothetical protein